MTIFSEELKSLIKNHLRHSLCSTPVSIQSRIYLDDEEISNLRQEKPAPKELSDEEILVLYEEFIETQYVSESNVLGFGRAILKKASEE